MMDTTDIELLRKSLENALASAADDTLPLLVELGWPELFETDPRVATAELFEAQGRLLAASGALDLVVTNASHQAFAAGTAFVHPRLDSWDAPPGRAAGTGGVPFAGIVLSGTPRVHRLLVPFHEPGGQLAVATVGLADIEARDISGFDASLGLVAVSGRIENDEPRVSPSPVGWGIVASTARRALAHELCAVAGSMLDQATAYVSERHQFGRPIATFQSVRHQLTEVHVALASARAALDASWACGDLLLADAAKALAGRAGILAARHCLQVTGAIGFTEEYDLAARTRRIYLLDGLYGTCAHLQARIGNDLLTGGSVPRLYPIGRT